MTPIDGKKSCCSAAKAERGGGAAAAGTPTATPGKVIDPVCGMSVSPDSPHYAEHAGRKFSFCCAGCRTKFEADPSRYVDEHGERRAAKAQQASAQHSPGPHAEGSGHSGHGHRAEVGALSAHRHHADGGAHSGHSHRADGGANSAHGHHAHGAGHPAHEHQQTHGMASSAAMASNEPAPAGTIYTCPMHPEIQQVGPGTCPICGMALEPVMPTEV
jgi:Cu+-exporting ATPase